jgi:mono/diheme cytochrome c family protein
MAANLEAKDQLIRGMEQGLRGDSVQLDPGPLQKKISQMAFTQTANAAIVSLALRLKSNEVIPTALRMVGDAGLPESERKMLVAALADLRINSAVPIFLDLLQKESSESLRADLLASLQRFGSPEIAPKLIELYAGLSRHLQLTAQGVLASRTDWASRLLDSVDSGQIQPAQIVEGTLATIRKHRDPHHAELIRKHWQNQEQNTPAKDLQPVLQIGEQNYRSRCSYCHLASGEGMKKSLVNSKWVLGADRALIRIVLQGKEGEGETMPAFGTELDDLQTASILTYIRQRWGHQAQPIEPATVGAIRKASAGRNKPWTEEELLEFLK